MIAIQRLCILVALGLVAALTTGCDDTESGPTGAPADLVVEHFAWNGWDPDDVPEQQHASLVGAVGEKVTVESMGGITIEVVEVDGEEITLRTSEPMAPRTGSGVNLNDTTDTFVVKPGVPATFATATMDAGWDFEVRYDTGEPSPTPPSSTCAPETTGCGQPIE